MLGARLQVQCEKGGRHIPDPSGAGVPERGRNRRLSKQIMQQWLAGQESRGRTDFAWDGWGGGGGPPEEMTRS